MKKILLLALRLKNFKGMKSFEANFNSESTEIYGDNATGKTTLYDAYCWLLSGKDSNNQADFDIKTLDTEGNVIHGLEHEVEGKLLIDNEETVLTRTYVEKFSTKRGTDKTELKHETHYRINGVPKQKKDFDSFIASIASEEQLKLLTNPFFFNDDKAFPWKKRRELLLAVCGNITDNEVIDSNKKLTTLKAILNTKSIDDYRAIIAERKKVVNDRLEKIPERIDELTMGLSETTIDVEAINQELTSLQQEKNDKESAILDVLNDAAIGAKKAEIANIDNQVMQIKNEALKLQNEKQNEVMKEIQKLSADISKVSATITNYDYRLKANNDRLATLNKSRESLVAKYTAEFAKEFDSATAAVCPTCGQAIPEEKLQEAQEAFNKAKSEMLTKITEDGQKVKADIDALTADNTTIETEKADFITQKDNLQLLIEQKKTKSNEIANSEQENEQQKLLLDQKVALQVEITSITESKTEVVAHMRENVQELETKNQALRTQLATEESQQKSKKRIEELKDEEKKLTAEYSELEKSIFLTEEFIKTKTSMLEDLINSKFQFANFKMFEKQLNGGVNEICVATFQGVPFNSMNRAAKIIVGIDIINTLSKHFDFYNVMWIDNAESITVLPHSENQVVALYVNQEDKTLRVGAA
jgi:hypothetical protein